MHSHLAMLEGMGGGRVHSYTVPKAAVRFSVKLRGRAGSLLKEWTSHRLGSGAGLSRV